MRRRTISSKPCTCDQAIIAAFAPLRKNRELAAFTHEALKNFLTTEVRKTEQVLNYQKMQLSSACLTKFLHNSDCCCMYHYLIVKMRLHERLHEKQKWLANTG